VQAGSRLRVTRFLFPLDREFATTFGAPRGVPSRALHNLPCRYSRTQFAETPGASPCLQSSCSAPLSLEQTSTASQNGFPRAHVCSRLCSNSYAESMVDMGAKKSRPDGGWRELADTLGVLFRRPNPEPRTGPKPRQALLQQAANVLREHDFQTGASFILIGLNRAALFG
jgi:hypothetical protein